MDTTYIKIWKLDPNTNNYDIFQIIKTNSYGKVMMFKDGQRFAYSPTTTTVQIAALIQKTNFQYY